ncbi:MAG: TIGR01777 family oxidoreductase [Planctomycetota bacterium]|jgi:uncharacterized protein (TIGR01777 family)
MNVLVAGGTGFIGRRLVELLVERGDVVTVVSRDPSGARKSGPKGASHRGWLPSLDAYDAVVNLAGTNIFDRRWNAAVKQLIRDSRVQSTRRIVEAIRAAQSPPRVLVNGSAVGYYGDRGAETLPDTATPGTDFMAQVCRAWEEEALRCPVRTVLLRTGVVLGRDGGALKRMALPFKLGVGGPIGLGRQYFPWIHRDDLVGLILLALDNEDVHGPLNGVAPGTLRNAAFTRSLGRALHRPTLFPVPPLALRLAFGAVAQVLTASQRCIPEAAKRHGYEFRFPDIDGALAEILSA